MKGYRTVVVLVLSMFGFVADLAMAGGMNFPGYTATVTPEGLASIPLNKHINLIVTLKPIDAVPVDVVDFKFDARMPQHKHGMVTTPKISKVDTRQYRVEGVRLHMPGLWLFEFTIIDQNGETRFSSPFELKP